MNTVFQKFMDSDSQAIKLFAHDFRNPDSASKVLDKLGNKTIAPEIIELLQQDNHNISAASDNSLKLLRDKNCRVVITGQQIGLFGGPLLTLYKIISTIKVAKELSEQLSIPVVPIFWMQTEDHDLAEISTASFMDNSENILNFRPESLQINSQRSVGPILLDQNFSEEAAKFFSSVELPNLEQLLSNYNKDKSLAAAFRSFWQAYCSNLGILFFDPSDPIVKNLAKPLIEKALIEEDSIAALLLQNAEKIKSAGFSEQVSIRADSPLFFLELNQQRKRLVKAGDSFLHSDKALNKQQIKELVSNSPELFTSSALIRPVLQDFIFPNLAYISGPSEFNYWAQTLELYEYFSVTQPLVIPRANFRLLESKYQRILSKSGFDISDLAITESELLAKMNSEYQKPSDVFAFEKKWIEDLNQLNISFATVDQNLISPLQQTQSSISASLARLTKRYEESLLRKQSDSFNQLRRVKKVIFPGGEPQERVISAAGFLLKYGSELIAKLSEQADPIHKFETTFINL